MATQHIDVPADPFCVRLRLAERGDRAATAELYEQFCGPLAGYARRRRAEDPESIASAAFERTIRRLPDFVTFSERAFRAYLYRTARNLIIDEHRAASSRARQVSNPVGPLSELPDHTQMFESAVIDKAVVGELLDGLTSLQREVIEYRFFEDLSLNETGRRTGQSVTAVKDTQRRALLAMRAALAAAAAIILLIVAWRMFDARDVKEVPVISDSTSVPAPSPERSESGVVESSSVPQPGEQAPAPAPAQPASPAPPPAPADSAPPVDSDVQERPSSEQHGDELSTPATVTPAARPSASLDIAPAQGVPSGAVLSAEASEASVASPTATDPVGPVAPTEIPQSTIPTAQSRELETPDASAASDVPVPDIPAFEVPQFEVPQYEAPDIPTFEVPQYEAPQYEAPDIPTFEVPQYEAPQYEVPQYEAPDTYEVPQYEAPQYEAPDTYEVPRYQVPDAETAPPVGYLTPCEDDSFVRPSAAFRDVACK